MHIVAEITYNCPANCDFCPLKKEKKTGVMNFKKFVRVLELFAAYFEGRRKLLTISGGEPSTVKNLKKYVDAAKKEGYRVTVVTNGYNPKKIVEAEPDYVQISLDFAGERHNVSRKLDLWHKVLYLLEQVKAGKLKAFIRFTLMEDNLSDLVTIRNRLDAMGLKNVPIFAMPVRNSDNAPSKDVIMKASKYAILPSRCPAGKGMFVVTPDFRVLDCIFHREELGRFRKFTIYELMDIVSAGRKIKQFPCGEEYWWSKEG